MRNKPNGDVDVFGHCDMIDREVVAVDARCVAGCRACDAELVHDAGRNASGGNFCATRELGEFDSAAVETEGDRNCNHERRARRETGTDRQRCRDGARHTVNLLSVCEFVANCGGISTPSGCGFVGVSRLGGEIDCARFVFRYQGDALRSFTSNFRPSIYCHRKDEPAGVIGVIPNQIDSPGRSDANTHLRSRSF